MFQENKDGKEKQINVLIKEQFQRRKFSHKHAEGFQDMHKTQRSLTPHN